MLLENLSLSALRHLRVQDATGQAIGRIRDAVVQRETLALRGFVVHGSRLEEALEAANLRKDVDPLVSLDDITQVTERTLTINKAASELPNAAPEALAEDDMLFSALRKIPVLDVHGQLLGILADVYMNEDGTPAYQLGGESFLLYLKKTHCATDLMYLLTPDRIQHTGDGYQIQTDITSLEHDLKRSLTNLVRDLLVEAGRDGKITADEQALIDTVSVDIGAYQEALEQALADGVVTKEEEAQLESFKQDMLRRVHFIARQDDVGTRDEFALIRKLAAYMVDHREELFWKVFGVVHPGVGHAVQDAAQQLQQPR